MALAPRGSAPCGARRPARGLLPACTVAAWIVTAAAPGLAQQQITIPFRVADNTTFIETLRFDKTVVQGKEPPRRTLTDSRAHYTVRRTAKGYSIYVKPVKPIDMTVSADVAAIVSGMMTNLRLRYDLDSEGELTNVAGIEQTYSEVENLLPEQFRPLLRIMGLTPETLRQQVVFDWNARRLFLAARNPPLTFAVGQEREVDAPYPSALAGVVRAQGVMIVRGPEPCANARCVTWRSSAVSRDPLLGKALVQYLAGVMSGTVDTYAPAGKPRPKLPSFEIVEPYERIVLTRVIDVRTGLHHAYVQEHDARGVIVADGSDRTPMRVTVRREYSYAYD